MEVVEPGVAGNHRENGECRNKFDKLVMIHGIYHTLQGSIFEFKVDKSVPMFQWRFVKTNYNEKLND